MGTLKTTCVATGIILATLTGLTCKADEPQLQLHGKTIMVYPIAMGEPGKPDSADSSDMDARIAEVVGLMLEQLGMLPGILPERPKTISSEDNLSDVEKKLQAFQEELKTESDYTLFARIEGKRTEKGPVMTRVCAVLMDSSGQVVWSQDPSEFPNGPPSDPKRALEQISMALLAASDLKEPASREDVPYGPMAAKMDERSGVPPKPERDAMNKRFEEAHASFSKSTLTIYPFRIWQTEDGSVEGAEALAKKLNEAGLFKASAANTDTKLKATRVPNQMKIMWDTARDFRSYLREHPAGTDYALLVDVTIPTHHVHIVLCEGSGEWMTASLMNSHHPEFQEVAPKTLEDCVELAFRRLTATVQGQKDQEELAKEVAAYKPDPRHTGKYADQDDPSNYVELKPDGSFHVNQDGHEMQGTYAVVEGNTLVLIFPGKGSRRVGKLEESKLIYNDGDVAIKQ